MPAEDEPLLSYIDRIADVHDTTRGAILRRLGLKAPGAGAKALSGFSVALAEHPLRRAAFVLGIDPEQLRATLLVGLPGVSRLARYEPGTSTQDLAAREWIHLAGTPVCPQCLTQRDGAGRRVWASPWQFSCMEHDRLLLDSCPACEQQLAGSQATWGLNVVPRAGACCLVVPGTRRAVPRPICGHLLAAEGDAARAPALWPAARAAQARLIEYLAARDASLGDRTLRSDQLLHELRAITALVMRYAQPEDLDAPAAAAAGISEYTDERDRLLSSGEQKVFSAQKQTPRQTAVLAACLPAALRVLDAHADGSLYDEVRWLRERMESLGRKTISRRFGLPDWLGPSLSNGRQRALWQRPIAANGDIEPAFGFQVRHLPQLIWREAFDVLYADMLASVRPLYARIFVSMLLAKYQTQATWPEAIAMLGLHDDVAPGGSGFVHRISRLAADAEVRRRTEVLGGLIERSALIDYAERRQRFAARDLLPGDVWREMAATARVHPGRGARERNASIWLWSEITGSPFYTAPAAGQWRQTGVRRRAEGRAAAVNFWADYHRFYGSELPRLRPHLTRHAQDLVGDEPLRPLSRRKLAAAFRARA